MILSTAQTWALMGIIVIVARLWYLALTEKDEDND